MSFNVSFFFFFLLLRQFVVGEQSLLATSLKDYPWNISVKLF